MILKLFILAMRKRRFGRVPSAVGQKVVLKEGSYHEADESKPMEGSSFECGGTIIRLRKMEDKAHVKWCTGHKREFPRNMLKVISYTEFKALMKKNFLADNPNYTFKQRQEANAVLEEEVPKLDTSPSPHGGYVTGSFGMDISTLNNANYVYDGGSIHAHSGNYYFGPDDEPDE
jgi:hypothetical protein